MNFDLLKESRNVLSKAQMREVKGGAGTCGFRNSNGTYNCNLSKAEALHMYDGQAGSFWCCDSCSSTSYC